MNSRDILARTYQENLRESYTSLRKNLAPLKIEKLRLCSWIVPVSVYLAVIAFPVKDIIEDYPSLLGF